MNFVRRHLPMASTLAVLALGSAAVVAEDQPPAATAPAQPAPAAPAPAPPSLERVLEELARLDAKALTDRLPALQARAKQLGDEAASLTTRLAAHEAELPGLSIKVALLDAVTKARGTAPLPPMAALPSGAPPVDVALDQLVRLEPKALADHLAGLTARHKTLTDETAAMKSRLAAVQAELAPLAAWVTVLEALIKAKASLPASPPPPPPPAPPGNAAASPPADSMAAAAAPPAAAVTFRDHVQPLLGSKCVGCHNPDKAKGGLVLVSFEALMAGGGSGSVIVPGAPDQSRLFRLVSHVEEPYMPPYSSRLDDQALVTLRAWIESGAPREPTVAVAEASAAPQLAQANAGSVPAAAGAPPPPAAAIVPVGLSREFVRTPAAPTPVTALAVAPDGDVVALGASGQIVLYHAATGERAGIIPVPEGRVDDLSFTSDGAGLLAAAGTVGQLGMAILFDVETGRRVRQFDHQYDSVLAAACGAGDGLVAVGGTNRKVRVFDAYDGGMLFEIPEHTDWIMALAFSPDGLLLASADRGGGLMVWEADTGRAVHVLRAHAGAVNGLAFRADSQVLASGGADGIVRLWGMEQGDLVRQWSAHAPGILDVAFAADGRLATCGADGAVKLWNAEGGLVRTVEPRGDWVYRVGFAARDAALVAGTWSGAAVIVDLATGNPLHTLTSAP